MKTTLVQIGRLAVTLAVLVLAAIAGRWLWLNYREAPWTRDGRVRADVVEVAPDVGGLVTEVHVRDDQAVQAGEVLFVIDRLRYALAVRQAEAALQSAKANLAEAQREDRRNRALGDLVAAETREQGSTRVEQAAATVAQDTVAADRARLDLERTIVRASVSGTASNVELRPGDYLSPGRQALALVDRSTLHVDGYFEETKLPHIHLGDRARVAIMGETTPLRGHVESIAAGIEDRERGPSANLLPNVNPTFSWVRLAQRIPVRIALDDPPPAVRLIAGRTATVTILEPRAGAEKGGRR